MTQNDKKAVSSSTVTGILVLTTILWGGSFVFNKLAFREVPPITFMFCRFALATMIMGLFCLRRLPGLNRDIVGKGVRVGLALAAANVSFVLGVAATTVSRAGFLNNLFVLLIPVLCFLHWRERFDRWTLCGILFALAGLWELARGGIDGFNRGDFFSTICAVFISLHIILVSRILRQEDVFLVTLVQFATVTLVGGVLYLLLPATPFSFSGRSAGSLVYCALFPTVICFTLQNTYQRYTSPTKAGLIYTLDPIWSMIGGMVVLGERLTTTEWFGCSLIFSAVILPLAIKRWHERRGAAETPSAEPGTDHQGALELEPRIKPNEVI